MCITKTELRDYRNIVLKIKGLQEEIDLFDVQMVKAQDGMPRGSSVGNPTSTAGIRLASISEMLVELKNEVGGKRERIEKELSKLEHIEYDICQRYYLLGKSWLQVAAEVGYSERQVFRIHGEALLKLRCQ